MDARTIVRRRLNAQRLTGAPFGTPREAVAWSGAVQAQEYAEALWSLGMRVRDATAGDVEGACDRGEILRTHVMRPTWHFVAAPDLRWLLRLTGPRVQAKNARRYRELRLDEDTRRRCHEVLDDVLADGEPRTRRELGAVLAAAGMEMAGQRLPHALMSAELDGVIASGPRRGRQHTYMTLEGRVPAPPQRSREEDVAELVRRFFLSHGPATLRDFAWWSGLTIGDGRAGLAACGDALVGEEGEDGKLWICAASAPAPAPALGGGGDTPAAFLLGTFDELVVGHRDLRNVHADGRATNDLLARPIVVDGITVGGWTRRITRREVAVEVALDVALDEPGEAAVRAAAARFGAFLGMPATLRLSAIEPGRKPPAQG